MLGARRILAVLLRVSCGLLLSRPRIRLLFRSCSILSHAVRDRLAKLRYFHHMPKSIPPEKWERYFELVRTGYGLTQAGQMVGISRKAVTAMRCGDPSSSGVQYLRRLHTLAEFGRAA